VHEAAIIEVLRELVQILDPSPSIARVTAKTDRLPFVTSHLVPPLRRAGAFGVGGSLISRRLVTELNSCYSPRLESWTGVDQSVSVEKTLEKLLRGASDANTRFDEICDLLQAKGFRMRVSGSHHIFTKSGIVERINLQREGSKAKPYQVKQVRKILAKYKLL
jgi:predicted RNA binding protein YcfA (HicA-like mRNA interferase family)